MSRSRIPNKKATLLILTLVLPLLFTSIAMAKSTPITKLILYYPGRETQDEDLVESKLNDILKPKVGVELNLQAIDWSNYDPKLKVLIAAGEPMDLLFTAGWFNYEKYAKAGYLKDLTKYLAPNAPLLKSQINPLYLRAPIVDGKNYAIPTEMNSYSWKGILLNKQLVDKYKLDITKIKQLADLEPMLKMIKAKEKNVIPLFAKEIDFEKLAFVERAGNGLGALTKGKGTKLVNEFTTPEMSANLKLYYSWANNGFIQLNKQKLVDHFKDDSNKTNIKMTFAVVVGEAAGDLVDSINYSSGFNWIPIPLSKPYISSIDVLSSMLSIPAASKHPELAMKVIELLHTDKQLLNTLFWGVEDLHWIQSEKAANRFEWTEDSEFYQPLNSWMFGNPGIASLPSDEYYTDYKKLKPVFDKATHSPILGLEFNAVFKGDLAVNAVYEAFIKKQNETPQDPAKALPALKKALNNAGIDAYIADKQKHINQFLLTQK
jgi:putative aldouronate transport system substrate-binding protein